MTIVVTGGGSGGHITPVLAVAKQLKAQASDARLVYIAQRGDGLADIPRQDPAIDIVYAVSAGKLRRYHGEGLRQLLDLKTLALNTRDGFRTLRGFWQALRILRRERPAAIFIKGGFVGVPVGLAGALLRIPYVTHDSDAIPGLANRLIAPWARYHAVALPKKLYHYRPDKTVTVGVPTSTNFEFVDEPAQQAFKKSLDINPSGRLLFVTGGGLGAQRMNSALTSVSADLLEAVPDLTIVHTVGRAHEAVVRAAYDANLGTAEQGRVRVLGYATELYKYSGAADLIMTRAGATAIAEFAVQGRACLLVPNPYLTAGHQLKNAQALQEAKAVAVLNEQALTEDAALVLSTLVGLLDDAAARHELATNLHNFAHPQAAAELAGLILKTARRNGA
jgi:UDP-N-acetylglucosamine--N-acetylmuramyl-(pentapeptide) pyrophosphoryl-undecaprenol N-acetylglucosamine transferase